MMIIELFGLPGSGKSTVTNVIIDELSIHHYSVKTLDDFRKERENGIIRLALKNASLTFQIIRFIIQEHISFGKDKIRYMKSILMTAQYYKAHSNTDYLVMEQGWIQDLISLCYSHRIKKTKYLAGICENIGTLCIPIVTEIDPEKSFARMKSRSKGPGRLDKEDPDDQKNIYQAMQENINLIKSQLFHVISLDTTMDPKSNAESIIKSIVYKGDNSCVNRPSVL